MSEDALYEELFMLDQRPTLEKKMPSTNGADYLNNLFNEPPPSVVKPKEVKKPTFQHQYLKLAEEPSTKVQKKIVQLKQEKFLTKDQIRHRRNVQQFQEDLLKNKKETKKYGPTIINVFASQKDQQKKSVPPATKPKQIPKDKQTDSKIPLKKPIQKIDKILKKEQKKQKIHMKSQIQKKKQRRSSSSSSQSSSSNSSQGSSQEQGEDWRKELRQLTRYNPSDQKYKKRDRERIQQAGTQQIFRQDQRSRKIGRRQEELDFLREQAQKAKKHKRN